MRVYDTVFLYTYIKSQMQRKDSFIFPIKFISLHFFILRDISFAISAQACALLNAWCFFDSNEFGFSYMSSEANIDTHSVNTL